MSDSQLVEPTMAELVERVTSVIRPEMVEILVTKEGQVAIAINNVTVLRIAGARTLDVIDHRDM